MFFHLSPKLSALPVEAIACGLRLAQAVFMRQASRVGLKNSRTQTVLLNQRVHWLFSSGRAQL
jgi:hypothetical protein